MPKHYLGYQPSVRPDGETMNELEAFESALHGPPGGAAEAATLGQLEQIERDIAAIERASAALRKGEPALETWNASWSGDAPAAAPKPRPVWLLVGLLWLSTALVTVGAVAAIARLAG
jgi:hypothetical protein